MSATIRHPNIPSFDLHGLIWKVNVPFGVEAFSMNYGLQKFNRTNTELGWIPNCCLLSHGVVYIRGVKKIVIIFCVVVQLWHYGGDYLD